MRVLGLDLGERRIGVALSDPEGLLAIPLKVLARQGVSADLEAIGRLVEEQGVGLIVVGLPRSLNGSLGREAGKALAFSESLSQAVSVPVATWDERLSTAAAERSLVEAGVRGERRRGWRDAVAAALILQGYLDRARQEKNLPSPDD